MSRTVWAWARPVGGAAILAVIIWRLGTGPILDGLHTINVGSLAAAGGIAIVTTVCCAWRWTLVARGLGVGLPVPTAIAAYYRSQFLNTALPGGVLGDVHRAVRQAVCSATYTAPCATVATSAMSGGACALSPGSAPPGRLSRRRSRWPCC